MNVNAAEMPDDIHGHAPRGRLLDVATLAAEFGSSPLDARSTSRIVLADAHMNLLEQQVRIVEHQWRSGISKGMVRGFCLAGPPGTGKTTLAKLLGYELAVRIGLSGEGASLVKILILDGGDIATAKYGESERRIREVFGQVTHGDHHRSVIIFDDVESIFMSRSSPHAKEWHFSQDSVFFHAIDELDTSKNVVVVTTNRPDLVDQAIRDRFLEYSVDYPPVSLLHDIARKRAADQQYSEEQADDLDRALCTAIQEGRVRSLRDLQHFAVLHYVTSVMRDR